MKIIKDRLLNDYIYPCSNKEIKSYLNELPKEDLEGIKSIRLSNQRTDTEGGFLPDGRIEISYVVDKSYKKPLTRYPDEEFKKKWERFGGTVKIYNRKYYVCWNLKSLKNYIKFVLFHEIGHNVYNKKYGEIKGGSQEEKFCDEYALKHLGTKTKDRS